MDIDIHALKALEREREIPFDVLVDAIEAALLGAYHRTEGAYKNARAELGRKDGHVVVWAREEHVVEEQVPVEAGEGEEPPVDEEGAPSCAPARAASWVRSSTTPPTTSAASPRLPRARSSRSACVTRGRGDPRRLPRPRGRHRRRRHPAELQPPQRPRGLRHGRGVLPSSEQVPGEVYNHGDRIRVYVVSVKRGLRGPEITLSRTHPNLVRKIFAMEVPEIADGSVEISALAREAGHRTKIAVHSKVPGLNAKGACIGAMGARVRAVMAHLQGEKIDIVDWSDDPQRFIAAALSPSKVESVTVVDPKLRSARVVVPDYQLSLAIGKEGQNARLAAKLTGWRIDIRPDTAPDSSGGVAVPGQPEG